MWCMARSPKSSTRTTGSWPSKISPLPSPRPRNKKRQAAPDPDKSRRKRVARRNRSNLRESLTRIEQVVEPDSLMCPYGCGMIHKIGEDRTERLDIVPAQLRLIVTVRPKYACRACTDGVTQALAPGHLIEGGLPTEGAMAHVPVSKYADHLPLFRQSQILARSGISIHRSTLADWVGVAAVHLVPVVDRQAEHLKGSTKLFMDETIAPVLDSGEARQGKNRLFPDFRPFGSLGLKFSLIFNEKILDEFCSAL